MPERAATFGKPRPESRPDATQRGYDRKWKRARLAFLAAHPLCQRCHDNNRITEAVHVHHLDGQGPLGPRGFDPTNLQSLCESCHNSITALERTQHKDG